MSDDKKKPKPTITVAPAPISVEVIFVADYRKGPLVPLAEVDTPRLLGNAEKQKKKNEALKPPVKTYVFKIKSLGDVRKHLETSVKSSEIVSRLDFLAHGNRATTAFSGEVETDDVSFDSPAATTFDDFVAFFTLSDWEKQGPVDSSKQFTKMGAPAWQKSVKARLSDDATVHVYACHSGGEDTESLAVLGEGELLQAAARLFDRPATGFTGYLFWTTALTTNIYAKMPGVPTTGMNFHGRFPQADKDLDFYRDLETVTRKNFPAVKMAITRKP